MQYRPTSNGISDLDAFVDAIRLSAPAYDVGLAILGNLQVRKLCRFSKETVTS
jgi:hypothetical protein